MKVLPADCRLFCSGEVDADDAVVVADVDVSIGECRHAPDNFTAEGEIGRIDDFGPIDFAIACRSQFSQQKFSQFVEQDIATALSYDKSSLRSGRAFPDGI